MHTERPNNKHNHFNLRHPLYKKSKHSVYPVVTHYALMLLYVYQNNKGGYTKRELVAEALGHIDEKYKTWNNGKWAQSAFSMEFSAFNHNMLMEYEAERKLWFWGHRMTEYLKHHFGRHPDIKLDARPYDAAVKYNKMAIQANAEAKAAQEWFFQ